MTARAPLACLLLSFVALPALGSPPEKPKASVAASPSASVRANGKVGLDPAAEPPPSPSTKTPEAAGLAAPSSPAGPLAMTPKDFEGLKGVALIGLASLAPAALLMFTSFVRINIVLILLRQALGSPQVPGNQVLAALALLLSLLVMKPVGESVYTRAIQPYAAGARTAEDARRAWEAGSQPIKKFMIDQIKRTNHVNYLWELYDFAEPPHAGRVEPVYEDEFPLRVVAPAFLLSELTTALMIGFCIYLPFLVIDLVVSAVLSAMGLFMLPPSLVAMPLKLILFVLADGWLLVATALLRTFAT
jgi:flagellar biosynthesis protein FliP